MRTEKRGCISTRRTYLRASEPVPATLIRVERCPRGILELFRYSRERSLSLVPTMLSTPRRVHAATQTRLFLAALIVGIEVGPRCAKSVANALSLAQLYRRL